MEFIVFTNSKEPIQVSLGEIAANKKHFVFRDTSGTATIHNSPDVAAIMRPDFAESYRLAIEELERLKHGDPRNN